VNIEATRALALDAASAALEAIDVVFVILISLRFQLIGFVDPVFPDEFIVEGVVKHFAIALVRTITMWEFTIYGHRSTSIVLR
jgi:hypothetical protein